jgi:dUTP pyrophosphatase
MQVKIKKLNSDAIVPKYATAGAACFDIHTNESGVVTTSDPVVFSTGLSFEVPEGYVMLVFSRSGHGFKNNTRLSNCVGVIDSDYRGELKVKLNMDLYMKGRSIHMDSLKVEKGDRIAQAMLVPYPKVELIETQELSDTERGTGGLGSTGVK